MTRDRHPIDALAAHPAAEHRVEARDVDAETFAEARAFDEEWPGLVAVAVRDGDGGVLFVDSEDYGGWVLPGGRAEPGEDLRTAAAREVAEETGVVARVGDPLLVVEFVTRHDDAVTTNALVLFEGVAEDPETDDDPGLPDENIVEARWHTSIPEGAADHVETVALVHEVIAERYSDLAPDRS